MRALLAAGALVLVFAVASCGGDDSETEAPAPAEAGRGGLELSSPDWSDGEPVPVRFTCDGDEAVPAFRWSGVPGEAEELALTIVDPDTSSGEFSHWGITGIDPGADGLGPGELGGGTEVRNDLGTNRYLPPCPPENSAIPHNYVVTLFALEERLELDAEATVDELNEAAGDVAIAQDTLAPTYER